MSLCSELSMAPTSLRIKAQDRPVAPTFLLDSSLSPLCSHLPALVSSLSSLTFSHINFLAVPQTHQAFPIFGVGLLHQGGIPESEESCGALALTLITISKVKTPVKT